MTASRDEHFRLKEDLGKDTMVLLEKASGKETNHGQKRWHAALALVLSAGLMGGLACKRMVNPAAREAVGAKSVALEFDRERVVGFADAQKSDVEKARALVAEMNTTGSFWANEEAKLEKGGGLESVLYRGCVKFIGKLDSGFFAALPSLVAKCKTGFFSDQQVHPLPTDPDVLNSACDRMQYQLEIQAKLMGHDVFSSPQHACAVLVDLALPIDEEPPCMRFMEDLAHEHIAKHPKQTRVWPVIISAAGFKQTFATVCKEEERLDREAEGKDLSAPSSCGTRFDALYKLRSKKYQKLAGLLADVCPALGQPLEISKEAITSSTPRSLLLEAYHEAALIARSRVNHTSLSVNAHARSRTKQFNVRQLLEGSVRNKDRSYPLPHEAYLMCSQRAKSYELGGSSNVGVGGGSSVGLARGFQKWEGDHGFYGHYKYGGACYGVQGDIQSSASAMRAVWRSTDDVTGCAYVFSGSVDIPLPIEFGAGAGIVFACKRPLEILGAVFEFGIGLSLNPSPIMTNFMKCHARRLGTLYTRKFKKSICPFHSCFPADAQVTTRWGTKLMKALKVGDQVLVADKQGKLFFDDVYFFGHAEIDTVQEYVQLVFTKPNVSENATEGSQLVLEVSADHFLPTCEAHFHSCSWEQRAYTYARNVLIGSHVWVVAPRGETTKLDIFRVTSMMTVNKVGKYNPYTLSGNIVVNNALASAHSSWILDPWIPEGWVRFMPDVYQILFLPGRLVYQTLGPAAADYLDLNNPQMSPETYGYGPHFLAFSLLAFFVAAAVNIKIAKVVANSGTKLE